MRIEMEETREYGAVIKVLGLGGAGGNVIDRMISDGVKGVHFIAGNTDHQVLKKSKAETTIQLGVNLTRGLGAGGNPEVGRNAVDESREMIEDCIKDADMVFITAGMGGGTGTGSAPSVARVAKDLNSLTIAVVTKPFTFEGTHRMKIAEKGIEELKDAVDTLIVVPNDKLLNMAGQNLNIKSAFSLADDVLQQAVQGISDIITYPGLVNLDFADVKTIMKDKGETIMGTGIASGDGRALEAMKKAITSPLLEDRCIDGARGIIVNITGGEDLSLFEVNEAISIVQQKADPQANLIFGAGQQEETVSEIKITVIATGFEKCEEGRNGYHFNNLKQSRERTRSREIPTYIRDHKKIVEGKESEMLTASTRDIFDSPAFIRRRPD